MYSYNPTMAEADAYFARHIDRQRWSAADDESKADALQTASLEISSLPIRANAPTENIYRAIFEQAVFRLRSTTFREDMQAQGVKSAEISGGASETYGRLTFGIALAPRAIMYLQGCMGLGVIR